MVPEAQLEETEHGLVPKGEGWFVVNARDVVWYDRGPRGRVMTFEGEPEFEQYGVNMFVLDPGNPMSCTTGKPTRRTSSCCTGRRS